MAQSVTLKGAEIKVYIGGKLYPEVQSITWTIEYGEEEIFGIDSVFAQEIATTKVKIAGTVSGIRIKYSGGLQGAAARVKISEVLSGPYTSLRVQDRYSQKDILFVPQMKVTSESFQAAAKGIAKLNFNFKGIIPFQEIDLA
jgi:hypothetical protein